MNFKAHTTYVESSWNVTAHGNARKGKWRGNWRMEWVASTLHTTSEHGVPSITTADAHTSAASSRLNWRLFKWTCPFRRKTKSGFCGCAVTFRTQSTCILQSSAHKASFTFSLWKGSADWAKRSSTTAKWPPAHAKESGVWSLFVVCLLTSARFEMRNSTVHSWPARQAFINGVRPPSDSCSC